MSGLYEGCWHKLDRAREHVDALKRGIATRDFDAYPSYGLRDEFRRDLNCLSIFFADVETPPTEWSLIIGDALTNFRFRSLLGAMWLQMMFLVSATGKVRYCLGPGCNAVISFDQPQ